MFHFPGFASLPLRIKIPRSSRDEFPHSEISGSKVAWHLPEAYRSFATSFIASYESRHPPYALNVDFLLGNPHTTIIFVTFTHPSV